MPGNKISRFKAQFGYVDNDLFSVRYEKVRGALIEVKKAWEYLKASGPPGLGDSFKTRFGELLNAIKNAKVLFESNSDSNSVRKEAYETLEDVKNKSRALAEEISLVAKKTPTKITHDDGTTADVFPPDIPGFINMTLEEREKVVKQVGEKIVSGKKKVNEIISGQSLGDPAPAPDRKAVSDIMWFLKTTAESKTGEPYERGALTLPDPDNRLRKFFDRVGEVYTRDSSHLGDQQKKPGGQARGIDFYEGVDKGAIKDIDNFLPSGMCSVLLQQVETPTKESRLYVKMETESARWNPFHAILGKQSDAPESRPFHMVDIKNSMVHLVNLIKSLVGVSQGDDPTLRGFREKVPGSVTKAWKVVVASAKGEAKGKLKSAKSISQMCEAILAVYGLDIDDNDDFWKKFETAASHWQETVMKGLPTQTVQDIEELYDRFGGEIVLGTNDLTTPPVAPTAPNNFSFYRQGNDGLCAYYSLCHFQNEDIGKEDFLRKAAAFYKGVLKISDEDALKFVQDGNDPWVLIVFGLKKVTLTDKDLYILADVGLGHFTTVRKVNGSWWSYDSTKSAPVFIGDEDTLRGVAEGKLVYG